MFLSADEVGRELGISRSRVYELAAAGQLPFFRMGRRMWFPRRGLEALGDEAIRRVTDALATSA
jgi:excisionase family DNA binding protein